jgi:hypothetical protein
MLFAELPFFKKAVGKVLTSSELLNSKELQREKP